MIEQAEINRVSRLSKQLRLIALLDSAERVGMIPMSVLDVHTIAFLADALAPVWNLPIIDGQILKRRRPYYPTLQKELDFMVAVGIVSPSKIEYIQDDSQWLLDTNYRLNREIATPILRAAQEFGAHYQELEFVTEVVYAFSSVGSEGIPRISGFDATYSNRMIDIGRMINVDPDQGNNPTTSVALRFRKLLGSLGRATSSELIHLYVKELYGRLNVA